MKELSGGQLQDEFLKNQWLQRLPSQIQSVLSVSSETLDKLAEIADKVADVALPTAVYSATSAPEPNTFAEIQELAKQIVELKLQISHPLTKLSTRGERFTGSEPQIKTLAASLDSEYAAILQDFPDLTRPRPFNEKIKHNTFHYIETFDPPLHARARKLNPQQSEAAKKEFQYMLDQGIIIPSKSN
ncbi:hypothetical protein TNCV_4026141 [Trichonephila clavipes]|nr:hypothetical protein TNCV_4026141 [Trichonephila clavipes]